MVTNPPKGDGRRNGAGRGRSQTITLRMTVGSNGTSTLANSWTRRLIITLLKG